MKFLKKLTLLTGVVFLAASCSEKEAGSFGEEFSFLTVSGSALAEDNTTEGLDIIMTITSSPSSDLSVDLEVTADGAVEGVDFSFPDGKVFTIEAGTYSDTLRIVGVQNEQIDAPRSIALSIAEGKVTLSNEVSATLSMVDDDFFCPRNSLAKVVTTELDVGYSSAPVSIEATGEPGDGCYTFRIIGGTFSFLNAGGNQSIVVTLVEDSEESSTGTVLPVASFNLPNADGSGAYGVCVEITGGTYDLDAGTMDVNYNYLSDCTNIDYPGTLRYSAGM